MSTRKQATQSDPAEHPGLVIRDRRRIDPVTGQVRPQPVEAEPVFEAGAANAASGSGEVTERLAEQEGAQLEAAQAQLAERTTDLQRLQAEYLNYRRRVERDRQAVGVLAVAGVLVELLPVFDDIDRARAAGELTGGFKSVAESLEAIVAKQDLQRFGEAGEEFDPHLHEVFTHLYSDEVDRPTCLAILQPGYRIGGRLLRPARVAVAEPTAPFSPAEETAQAEAARTQTAGTKQPEPSGQAQSAAPFAPDESPRRPDGSD